MAAVLAVLVGTLPALCLIPPYAGIADPNPRRKKPMDAATPWHFRSIYAGLMGLGSVVVGASIMELYDSQKDHSFPHGETGEDDEKDKFGDRDMGRAALILGMWLVPILNMLWIPRKNGRIETNASEEQDIESEGGSLLEEARAGQGVPHLPQRLQQDRKRGRGSRYTRVVTGDDDEDMNAVGPDEENNGLVNKESMTFEKSPPEEQKDGDDSASAGSEIATGIEIGQTQEDISISQEEHLIHEEHDLDERSRPRPCVPSAPPPPSSSSAPRPLGELPLTEMLRTPAAWLLLWTCTILCGGGTVMTNNVGQMVEALRLDPDTAPAALAIFSAAQAAGRVCTGAMSESALNWKRRIPRPAFLMVASVFGSASHAVLALASTEVWFVAGVAMTGWAFGMIWPLMVLIVGETFGTHNVGANYMFYDGVTSAAGTLLMSKFVAQEVYESHIHRDHSIPGEDAGEEWGVGEDDGLTCYGMGCFQMSHAVVSGLSLTCICSSAALMYKTREVYDR